MLETSFAREPPIARCVPLRAAQRTQREMTPTVLMSAAAATDEGGGERANLGVRGFIRALVLWSIHRPAGILVGAPLAR